LFGGRIFLRPIENKELARQAAAAVCSFPAAYLTGIGLRIYDSGAQAQKRFAGLGAAPYSQCSQGSGEK